MPQHNKFEDIPELTEEQARFHCKDDYTYIINADKYQKTGELELKRVLKEDLNPHASASYVFFRREGCSSYPLSDKDLLLASSNGVYVSPFQMNNTTCDRFLTYARNDPELQKDLPDVTRGRKGTDGYLKLAKDCHNKNHLKTAIEDFAISHDGYCPEPADRAQDIARQLKLTDENGNPDATRLPLYTIAALPTHVISTGNSNKIKNDTPQLSPLTLKTYSQTWINCSNNVNGEKAFNELADITYLTADNISQYQSMGLAGAEALAQRYEQLVQQKEQDVRDFFKNQLQKDVEERQQQDMARLNTPPNLIETMPEIKVQPLVFEAAKRKRRWFR